MSPTIAADCESDAAGEADARRLGVPGLGDRTAEAVQAAWSVAEPWRGRWE